MLMLEIILLAVGLAMDAFTAAICKGMAIKKVKLLHVLVIGSLFGGFQALMPLLGYGLGKQFRIYIEEIDHWIAFILLCLIGINMIKESFEQECENKEGSIHFKELLVLAIATSIDALAVGVSFAFLDVRITSAACMIGMITFFLSCCGVLIGNVFGKKYKNKASLFGGFILIMIGLKILLEHFHHKV